MLAKRTGSLRTLRFRRSDGKRFRPAHCRTDALPKQAPRRQRKRETAPTTGRGMPIRFRHLFLKKNPNFPERKSRPDNVGTTDDILFYRRRNPAVLRSRSRPTGTTSGERFRGNTIRDKDSIMHRPETLRRKTDRTLPTSAVAMRILPVRPVYRTGPKDIRPPKPFDSKRFRRRRAFSDAAGSATYGAENGRADAQDGRTGSGMPGRKKGRFRH